MFTNFYVLLRFYWITRDASNPKITWEVKGHLKIAFAQMIAGHKGIFYEIIYTNIRSMS